MADDLGYADLSCCGQPDFSTPNIDRIAARGVRFTQAYANSAVCSATRLALIAGRYHYRLPLGLEEPLAGKTDVGLPPEHPTLPSLLRRGLCDRAWSASGIWACCRCSVRSERLRPFLGLSLRRGGLLFALRPLARPPRSLGGRRGDHRHRLPDRPARRPRRRHRQCAREERPAFPVEPPFQRSALAVEAPGDEAESARLGGRSCVTMAARSAPIARGRGDGFAGRPRACRRSEPVAVLGASARGATASYSSATRPTQQQPARDDCGSLRPRRHLDSDVVAATEQDQSQHRARDSLESARSRVGRVEHGPVEESRTARSAFQRFKPRPSSRPLVGSSSLRPLTVRMADPTLVEPLLPSWPATNGRTSPSHDSEASTMSDQFLVRHAATPRPIVQPDGTASCPLSSSACPASTSSSSRISQHQSSSRPP